MKRVLLTVHKFFPEHRAGTEVLTLKVAQELQRRHYEVLVLTANPPDQDARRRTGPAISKYEYEGVPVHAIEEPLRQKHNTFHSEAYNEDVRKEFGELLQSFAPDLVHAFHIQNLSSCIVDEACARGIPVFLSATDFWFICPVVQLRKPNGALCRGPSAGAANCLTCYTPQLFPKVAEFTSALKSKYQICDSLGSRLPRPLKDLVDGSLYATYVSSKIPSAVSATMQRPGILKRAANKLSAIAVPTKLMKDLFIENGIKAELIRHVPFGIDTKPLEQFQQKVPSDVVRIGYIGALAEHKGVDLLIRAFQSLPGSAKATLTIYGDLEQFPDYGALLKRMVAAGPPISSQIRFPGAFPNSQLGAVFTNLDVLIVPSRWYENTPLVIQSALACKTPVIATNLGGMSELVKHGENGLLFKVNDHAELANQLRELTEKPDLLERLRNGISPERNIPAMVDDIECMYRDSVKASRPREKSLIG